MALRCAAAPVDDLIRRSREKKLAQNSEWLRLLHYNKTLFFGYKSDIDGPDFFLSKHGRRDPQAELEATLTAFFEPDSSDPEQQHPQCRYPARLAWLQEHLEFPLDFPERRCARFLSWREKLNPKGVSLVFASYYMNNPASMYGHTFLRLKRRSNYQDEGLLDYTINFAATVNTTSGIIFAVKGLAGGYPGRFSTEPYYTKIQKYNNLESRDLWEYELALDQKKIDRLVEHLWELGPTSFSYYFLNKNCSYQLLPLLEAADPTLHLSRPFRFRAIPLDTLRAILDAPGLSTTRHFRPSHLRLMQASRERLHPNEKRMAQNLVANGADTLEAELRTHPPERQALVLDAAYDYLKFRSGFARVQPADIQDKERKLLLRRNELSVSSLPKSATVPVPTPPEIAHGTGRVGMSFGADEESSFEEVSFRGALHDLEADPSGFIPGSQLEMLHLRFRYDNKRGKAYIEKGTLLSIRSLAAWETWVRKPSWAIQFGLDNAHDLNRLPEHSTYGNFQGASGVAFTIPFVRDGLFYAMAEVDSGVGGVFETDYRVGAGGSSGILLNLFSFWRAHFRGSYIRYGLGDDSSANRVSLVNAFSLSKSLEGRISLSRENGYQEGMISLNIYY